MGTWSHQAIAAAVQRVAATTRGAAIRSELFALGWRWGNTRETIDRNKKRAEQSPHAQRIHWLLSELYTLELAELEKLEQADDTRKQAPLAAPGNTLQPNGVEGTSRGCPFET